MLEKDGEVFNAYFGRNFRYKKSVFLKRIKYNIKMLEKIEKLLKYIKGLIEKKYSGWIKINFHEGNLQNKVEHGTTENLE